MSAGIQSGVAVETRCFNHQSIAIPSPDRGSVPGFREVRRPLEIRLCRNPRMPCVLLEQESDRVVVLEQLHAMWRVDVSRPSKGQAAAGVVPVRNRVILGPLLPSPFRKREIEGLGSAFGIGESLSLPIPRQGFAAGSVGTLFGGIQYGSAPGHVCSVRVGPVTAEIWLAIGKSGRWSCRSLRLLTSATAAASATASASAALSGCRSAATCPCTATRAGGRPALLARWGLNGNDDLRHDHGRKNDCQSND